MIGSTDDVEKLAESGLFVAELLHEGLRHLGAQESDVCPAQALVVLGNVVGAM